jgi:3-oxoacyl-[acyl-carrier protein] reductase
VKDDLDGQIALVTGGSRGIGREIAIQLAGAGARVALTSRTQEAAEVVAQEIRASGGDALAVAMDISDTDSVQTGVNAILEDYGRIAILVNNAGITADSLLLRMKEEDWDRIIQTNLSGVYRVCRVVVPKMMRARYGRIVNITSVVASAGNPGQTNYAAAKAGVEGFTRSLAREIASRNITVNCIAPGFIETDMTKDLSETARETLLNQVPLNRLGQPADVAAATLYLAGSGAAYVTGITLNVNGGMQM